MKKIADYYEAYWRQEKELTFAAYERNFVLPPLFKQHEIVLDLGCGDGAVARFLLQEKQAQVIGLDFSYTALTKASQKYIPVVAASIESNLPFKSASFDVVFFGDVIEHLFNPQTALQEISRLLKPQGRLILSCPNMGYWRYRWHYLINGNLPNTEWIQSELWLSQHIRFFNRRLLDQLLTKFNFYPTKFFAISRRRLDQPFLALFPALFGMIMVVEAVKKS